MFFYLAFIGSRSLGGLIATSQHIGALLNLSRAADVPQIIKGLGIDLGVVSIFAFLYYGENNAKNAQVARLSREENLLDEKRILPLSTFRGRPRLVIVAGPASLIEDSFKLNVPFSDNLLERGVLVVPFMTDGSTPKIEFEKEGRDEGDQCQEEEAMAACSCYYC
ncbi:LOW PSII ACCUMULATION-like protein [Perilla frutescens var. frutescens]|nr:LOW PSII ACCUMULATION-like protein [Perilla frutescens var. frutescens]